mmetsp:Transcript_29274/g.79209  ORF Transcript_29274/g.79209 Transcript_29274/m.79209 type:complete len:222 (-) Transcript_29274:4290-4955(-)
MPRITVLTFAICRCWETKPLAAIRSFRHPSRPSGRSKVAPCWRTLTTTAFCLHRDCLPHSTTIGSDPASRTSAIPSRRRLPLPWHPTEARETCSRSMESWFPCWTITTTTTGRPGIDPSTSITATPWSLCPEKPREKVSNSLPRVPFQRENKSFGHMEMALPRKLTLRNTKREPSFETLGWSTPNSIPSTSTFPSLRKKMWMNHSESSSTRRRRAATSSTG